MVRKEPIRKEKKVIQEPEKKAEEKSSPEVKEAPKGEQEMPEQMPEEKPPSLVDMLSEFIQRKDAEDIEKYAHAVLEKFGRYIKSIAIFGSKKTKVKTVPALKEPALPHPYLQSLFLPGQI